MLFSSGPLFAILLTSYRSIHFLLLGLLTVVLSFPSCSNVSEIPAVEYEALTALFNTTDGPNWTSNSGWLETDTPCSWHGVTCNAGHVTGLDLNRNQLSGSIPAELGNLSDLDYLGLFDNELNGSIPVELGNLSNLTSLTLTSNQLGGSIPAELGNLSNLTGLDLVRNQLSGSIPAELSNLSNLKGLHLESNQLSGSIPAELGNLSNLTSLLLSDNQLSGSIPVELGNLSNLTSLALQSNQLSGPLPQNLTHLNLTYFSFRDTALCEPPDAGFKAWLSSIRSLNGRTVACN